MLTELTVNGVTIPLVQATIKRGKENKGKTYLVPDFDKVSLDDLVKAYGSKIYESIVQPKVTQYFQNLFFEAYADEAETQWVEEDFVQSASALSARGETVAVLMDRLFALVSNFSKAKTQEEFQQMGLKAAELTRAIETKKRKTKEDKEAESESDKNAVTA